MRNSGNKCPSLSSFFSNGSPSKILVAVNVIAFVLQAFGENAIGRDNFQEIFGLSCQGIMSGKIWTLLTYSFMHADLLHIFCNMLGLYFIGQYVERIFGNRRFYALYFLGAISGGLLWLLFALPSNIPEILVGASASVMALFAAFCLSYPPMPVTFLLFFVIPISMRPMTMLKIAAAMEVLGLLFSFSGGSTVVAYSAHLGGMAMGLAFVRLTLRGKLTFIDSFKMPKFWKKKKTVQSRGGNASDYSFRVNISNPEINADVINKILDKIGEKGFSSLTDSEREILRNARDNLKK